MQKKNFRKKFCLHLYVLCNNFIHWFIQCWWHTFFHSLIYSRPLVSIFDMANVLSSFKFLHPNSGFYAAKWGCNNHLAQLQNEYVCKSTLFIELSNFVCKLSRLFPKCWNFIELSPIREVICICSKRTFWNMFACTSVLCNNFIIWFIQCCGHTFFHSLIYSRPLASIFDMFDVFLLFYYICKNEAGAYTRGKKDTPICLCMIWNKSTLTQHDTC